MNHLNKRADNKGNIKFLKSSLDTSVTRSVSNNKREGPLERTPSIDEPSLMTIACFKIKSAYACCNFIETFCL